MLYKNIIHFISHTLFSKHVISHSAAKDNTETGKSYYIDFSYYLNIAVLSIVYYFF